MQLQSADEGDLEALVHLRNAACPWAPAVSVDQARRQGSSVDRSRPRMWLKATDHDRLLGWAHLRGLTYLGGPLFLELYVHPDHRRRGIGSTLLDSISTIARDEVGAFVAEESDSGQAFAAAHGFTERYRIFDSVLDLSSGAPVEDTDLNDTRLRIIDLGSIDSAARRRELYEVVVAVGADVPSPDPIPRQEYRTWESEWLAGPVLTPIGMLLGLTDDRIIGFSAVARPPEDGPAHNVATGVVRSERGQGVARRLKIAAAQLAAAEGYSAITTSNNTTNEPMLAVNRRLGYRRLPGRIRFGR